MDEVTGPIIAVALVLCAVFVPCAFVGGITGQFFRQFAVTISVSTVFSAINSLTLSPALAAILLKPREHRRDPLSSLFETTLRLVFRYFQHSVWLDHLGLFMDDRPDDARRWRCALGLCRADGADLHGVRHGPDRIRAAARSGAADRERAIARLGVVAADDGRAAPSGRHRDPHRRRVALRGDRRHVVDRASRRARISPRCSSCSSRLPSGPACICPTQRSWPNCATNGRTGSKTPWSRCTAPRRCRDWAFPADSRR